MQIHLGKARVLIQVRIAAVDTDRHLVSDSLKYIGRYTISCLL